jgi:hypothetical protein
VPDIFLKNIGVDREDVRQIWRVLGGTWRACANRAVRTALITLGESHCAELGQAFPTADGVVLDLLGSGTHVGAALDVQVGRQNTCFQNWALDEVAHITAAGLAQQLLLKVPTTQRNIPAAHSEGQHCDNQRSVCAPRAAGADVKVCAAHKHVGTNLFPTLMKLFLLQARCSWGDVADVCMHTSFPLPPPVWTTTVSVLTAWVSCRSGRLRQAVFEVHTPRDYMVVTIQRPDADGGEHAFRSCLSEIFQNRIHTSHTWVGNLCVVSIMHHIPSGVPCKLSLLGSRDIGTIASDFLHTSMLRELVNSKSVLSLQISRPLTIQQPQHVAVLQEFSRLTTLTSFEGPDIIGVLPSGGRLLVHGNIWQAVGSISGLEHLAVINTGSNLAFDFVEHWQALTALTSLELGKPWGPTSPPAQLLQLARRQLAHVPSWKQLQSLVIRARGTCFDDMPAPTSPVLTNLVLLTSPDAQVPPPAWLPAIGPTLIRMELGPLDLTYDVFT